MSSFFQSTTPPLKKECKTWRFHDRDLYRGFQSQQAPGTALGGLIGSGVKASVRPSRGAQELRIEDAKVAEIYPPLLGGMRHAHPHRQRPDRQYRGRPTQSAQREHLCPKGAAIFQLHVNPRNRPTQVLHRAAGAANWEVWDLERAMNRIAELVKKTRDETFIEKLPNGKLVNMTPAIFSLGGATLEVEFNHVHQKLMRGLGIVAIENQARI